MNPPGPKDGAAPHERRHEDHRHPRAEPIEPESVTGLIWGQRLWRRFVVPGATADTWPTTMQTVSASPWNDTDD